MWSLLREARRPKDVFKSRESLSQERMLLHEEKSKRHVKDCSWMSPVSRSKCRKLGALTYFGGIAELNRGKFPGRMS